MRGRMVSKRSSSAEKRRTPRGAVGVHRLAAREGLAAGDAGGELAEEGALAETGIAVEDGDLAGGDATRPEPAQWLGGDVAEADGVAEGLAIGSDGEADFLGPSPSA